MTRTKSSLKNIKYALVGQGLGLIISFLARIVFIKILNAEYLGLNGLFSNIVSILSLAELGIGSAMIYSMYEPLANNNIKKLKSLMYIYKKAYTFIGFTVLIVGSALIPFLKFFIKGIPDIGNIYLIYIIFVLTSAISYFFSYKRSLIIADQKKYLETFYQFSFFFCLNILQIIALWLTHNYILFLILKLIFTFIENLLISIKADKLYPYLKEKNIDKLELTDRNIIIRNVKAMFIHRIGGVVVLGTDNLLISKFVGLASVGLFSNYSLITNALKMVFGIMFQSLTASIGNLGVTESNEKVNEVFNFIDFISFWVYGFAAIALINLFNPFINLWVGEEYLFPPWTVLLIVINFYLQGQRSSVITFKDAFGLFWNDRYKPILESVLNLLFSIILARKFGVAGVLMGTMISTICTVAWIEPYVLFKYGLKKSVGNYFLKYLLRITLVCTIGLGTWFICNFIDSVTIWGFLVKFSVCLVVPNLIFIAFFRKTNEYKFLINFLKSNLINGIRGIKY